MGWNWKDARKFDTGKVSGLAWEGDIDDIRLQNLFNFGMLKGMERVRFKIKGELFGEQFKEYSIEMFGIKATENEPDQTAGRGYFHREDGSVGSVHFWMRRVRWQHTKAAYEELWYQPERRWISVTNYIEYVPVERRITDLKKLVEAVNLGFTAQEAITLWTPSWPHDEFLKKGKQAIVRMIAEPKERKARTSNRKIKVPQKKLEDRRLADLMGITTPTLYNYYKYYKGSEQELIDYFGKQKDLRKG